MRKLFLLVATITLLGFAVSAQETKPDVQPTPEQRPANLLQQLGLSPEQVQQIRRMNMQRKPLMDDAQLRVREANRALDAAIYADNVDENDVKARLTELQRAQADVARIRSINELAIRRILTPEQLGHFRELRQRFEQARQAAERDRQGGANGRGNGLNNGANPGLNDRQNLRRLIRQNQKLNEPAAKPPRPQPQQKPDP